MNYQVLLTGATGFVGQNLIPYLLKYHFKVSSLNRAELRENVDFTNLDAVVHLAGKAHDLKKTANADEYYEVNYELTKKIYDAFLKSDAKKFIFVSSVKAVADTVADVLTEETLASPQTHYGKSKLMAEDYILAQQLPDHKKVYILRPCMIHGPGNKGNLNLLYQFVKRGIPYPLAAFKNRRSFLSIKNLCFVIKKLIEMDILSGVYNVADDQSLSTTEVVGVLARSIGKKPLLMATPKFMVMGLAKIGDLFRMPLNTERLNKLTENYEVSNQKIVNALNIRLPISTSEGLLLTANSFKISREEITTNQ